MTDLPNSRTVAAIQKRIVRQGQTEGGLLPFRWEEESEGQCVMAIVGLAKAQHARGLPFERVVIRRESVFTGMERG